MSFYTKGPEAPSRGKYRCAVGGEFLSIQDFPESQNRLMQQRSKKTSIDPNNCGMTCRKHMGIKEAIYQCNGVCGKNLLASRFSASTRKSGLYICKECSIWRNHEDAGAPIPQPGQQVSIIEEEQRFWDHPLLSERMMDVQIANNNQTTIGNLIPLLTPLPGEPDHYLDDPILRTDLVTRLTSESHMTALPGGSVVPLDIKKVMFAWWPPKWVDGAEEKKEQLAGVKREWGVYGMGEVRRSEVEVGELEEYFKVNGIYEKLQNM